MKFLRNSILALITTFLFYLSFYPLKSGFLIFFAIIPVIYIYRHSNILTTIIFTFLSIFLFYTFHYRYLTYIWSWKVVIILNIYIAGYYALWMLINAILKIKFQRINEIILSASILAILEIIKGNILGGWPGGTLASSIYNFLPFIQSADLASFYFISMLIIIISLGIYSVIFEMKGNKINILMFIFFIFILNIIYGYIRINRFKEPGVSYNVYYIQPNIAQQRKWDSLYLLENLKTIKTMLIHAHGNLVVLPETVTPNDFTKFESTKNILNIRGTILFGSEYFSQNYFYDYYNTLKRNGAFLMKDGRITGVYFKLKPVPFAEYSPFKFTKKLLLGKNITPGKKYTVFKTSYGNFSVNICFESIFPELSRRFVKNGANIIFDISNEAWFETTPISMELLTLSLFRSIELRRDFIKVSNTGISAYVNSYGKITMKTGLFVKEAGLIQANLRDNKTIFLRYKYLLIYIIFLITLFIKFSHKKKKNVVTIGRL